MQNAQGQTSQRCLQVYAANKLEALQQLAQRQFEGAVLARQADTGTVAAALGAMDIPFCNLDTTSAQPVTVSANETVVVRDAELVVARLRAPMGRDRKP